MKELFTYLGIDIYFSDKPISQTHWLLHQNEFWKEAKDWENKYSISSMGRIKRLSRRTVIANNSVLLKTKLLKTRPDKAGYIVVSLSIVRKTVNKTIHSLIAKAFIPNPDDLKEVNHKNGVKRDNRLCNLEWSTRHKNIQHGYDTGLFKKRKGSKSHQAKLTEEQVLEIRKMREENPSMSYREIGEIYGVDQSNIYLIVKRKHWIHI